MTRSRGPVCLALVRVLVVVVVVVGVACRGHDDPRGPAPAPVDAAATASVAPSSVAAAPLPEPTIDPARACGEAGPEATPLPPALAGGLAPVGRGVIAPGATVDVGGVRFTHDLDAWIGLRTAGHRGPALKILIDAAEAKGGPYGDHVELAAGRSFRSFVGPYRIDGTIADGEPIGAVEVVVHREVCPASAEIPAGAEPLSLWVSTDAIRLHTFDLMGELLQVAIDGPTAAPRLDLSRLGYRIFTTPRPGAPWRVRIADHWLTVDEVLPGPGTRYDGEWRADDFAHAHARVRIEPAIRGAPEAPIAAVACGGPSRARSALPPELVKTPKIAGERTLTPAKPARIGDLELAYTIEEFEAPGHFGDREIERFHRLTVVDRSQAPPRHVTATTIGHAPTFVRDRQGLLRVELLPGEARMRVQHLTLGCVDRITLPRPEAPVHVWLSPIGVKALSVGDPDAPTIQIQVHPDPRTPTLSASFAGGYLSEQLRPESVGLAFSIGDDLVLEIVDVEVGADTRRVPHGWESAGVLPLVSVQVRLSPIEPPSPG